MKIIPLSVLISFVGLSFFLTGCDKQSAQIPTKVSHQTWPLHVTTVKTTTLPINYSSTGSVISDQRIDVASRTTGFIQKILVLEGTKITKGQLLIVLDDSNVEGAIRQAQAAANKASSTLKDAQTDLDRFEPLFKLGSISGEKLRKTKLQRDVAKDTLREAEAVLKIAHAQRQYIRIVSPITGTVATRHQREGDLAVPGSPILTVESSNGLLFETTVTAREFGDIKPGDSARVKIDALDNPLAGIVARTVPSADPLTRKFLIKIALPEHEGLLPGMFGRSYFQIGTEQAIVIPLDALIERGGLKGVYVVDNQNRAYFRWLRTGKIFSDHLKVLVGLQSGERVVSLPNIHLHEGDFISPEIEAEASASE